ncbi:MAG: flagellar basal body rod C-terminal domain-containing protein [Desulfocurvibacter africanus]
MDSLLYESEKVGGISSYLTQFFGDWQKLTPETDNYAVRETLLSDTNNLLSVIHQADAQMTRMQEQANQFIQQDVNDVNQILEKIAGINGQLKQVEIPGQNNANALRDDRDRLVRELAGKLDINVITRGNEQDFTITTKAGHTLLQNDQTYSLKFEGPRVVNSLNAGSSFRTDGQLNFDGTDDFEYTVQVVNPGAVDGGATFRVSLDGGKTWLKDDNGLELTFPAGTEDNLVEVRGVKIWFSKQDGTTGAPTGLLEAGDSFQITPKSGVYWYQDTSTSENITPQIYANGEDNNRRITGGSLAGFFNFRDNYIGQYRDKLDALAKELVWSVNSIHSEGAGLKKLAEATGTYQVFNSGVPLADDTSGLFFRDKLEKGSLSFYAFDATGKLANGGEPLTLDFDSVTPGQQNFDPAVHSLTNVQNAINYTLSTAVDDNGNPAPIGDVQASIVNGSLRISTTGGYTFGFGQDSTGLLAGLGINTYFSGTSARSIEINSAVASNTSLINAGHYNGAGEINEGDNLIASDIAALKDKKLDIHTDFGGTAHQTLSEFYNALVSSVGGDTSGAQFNFSYHNSLAQDLDAQQQSLSGVNLDEEMSNLIKFQHSYTAAAKLISTADQMLQTLLGLKP